MSDERTVGVTRATAKPSRELRLGRGTVRDLVGPAHGSGLDIHVNELRGDAGPGPYHLHTNAESVFIVLGGRVVVRIDGEEHVLVPGDAAFVPPNVPHSVSPAGGEPARLIEIQAPAKPDFIPVEQGGLN